MLELPLISAVIVSYNTRQMTLDCLRSLYADLEGIPAEVWVVDNASTDDSPAAVRAAYPEVHLIVNDHNAGFGAANNRALEQSCGEFLLLINSDAFPKPGATAEMVRYLREHSEVGLVGPRLLNADDTLQRSCFRLPSPGRAWLENLWLADLFRDHPVLGEYRFWAHDEERRVGFVSGACMLVRREVYAQVGGFDEQFFMYSEESDWQHRMHDAGWKIAFIPTAQVTHLGGGSSKEPSRINQQFFDSLDRYVRKHHGLTGLLSLRLAMLVGCAFRTAGWLLVLIASPQRRELARSKVRLLSWLCVRQATYWPLRRIQGGNVV